MSTTGINGITSSVSTANWTKKSTTGSSDTSFDQQLSQALSESLQKLGVAPGEINISIRNSADALASRQIVITYNASSTGAAGSAATTGSASKAASTFGPTTSSAAA